MGPAYTFDDNALVTRAKHKFEEHTFVTYNLTTLMFCQKINPFHTIGLFLYLLKTSENLRISNVYRGYRNRPVVWGQIANSFFSESGSETLKLVCVYCMWFVCIHCSYSNIYRSFVISLCDLSIFQELLENVDLFQLQYVT